MYYHRNYDREANIHPPEFDARNILRVLNYFPFINRRHVELLKESLKDQRFSELFCDMSAAAVTQLHEHQMLDLQVVWETVSQFFHQAIQLRGFETVPSPREEFSMDRDSDTRVEFLVAGTQSPVVFQSRVDRCIEVIKLLCPKKCHITFSGANPFGHMKRMGISGGVVTINEAADMEIYFRQRIENDPLPKGIELTLSREAKSDSTLSNIDNFFKNMSVDSNMKQHIYIISSLFHLPRFIDLTTKRIEEMSLPVNHLTFVSAEDPWKPHTKAVAQVDYLKSCMYEFFLQLYKEQEIESLFHPVTQNC